VDSRPRGRDCVFTRRFFFNRYYFSQINKEGAVIDERFNGGGSAADYIIDYMRRPLMNMWTTREGKDLPRLSDQFMVQRQ